MNKAAQKQPIIGIVPTFDDGVVIDAGGAGIERVYLRRDYLGAISSVGAIPFIITPEISMDSLQDICDGIVISGGLDIDSRMYGEEPLPELREVEPNDRFSWEKS